MSDYIYEAQSSKSVDVLRTDLEEAIKTRGFGVLTEINVLEVMKNKGVDFNQDIRILGICNPNYAKKALLANEDVAIMLPCTVVIYGRDGGSTLKLGRPTSLVNMFSGEGLAELGLEVETIIVEGLTAAI